MYEHVIEVKIAFKSEERENLGKVLDEFEARINALPDMEFIDVSAGVLESNEVKTQ